MKTTLVLLSAAILAVACTHVGGTATKAATQSTAAEDEAALATALVGREAGLPQDCVAELDLGTQKAYGRNVIVFAGRNGDDVLWVNRTLSACPDLTGRSLKTRVPATRLCRGDNVIVYEPASGIDFGSCSLGQFTPYRRVR